MSILIQLTLNSIIAGGIYALVAIGYTMVYGILKFLNFAHGDLAMVAAYLSLLFFRFLGIPFYISITFGITLVIFLGIIIEKIAYKPLRNASRLSCLITAIGVSIFLQSTVIIFFGAGNRVLEETAARSLQFIGASITPLQVIIVLVSITSMILLHLFIKRAKIGKAMRAVADNMTIAWTLGIDVDQVISFVFMIGSGLAGVAGILIAWETNLNPTMGFLIGMKAFTAAVLGGIGSIRGAVVGAYLIGFAENFGVWFIPTGYKNAIAFVVLILILLTRPSGIFGVKQEEEIKE
jgi:branched-chain amino acid transport system permease protein